MSSLFSLNFISPLSCPLHSQNRTRPQTSPLLKVLPNFMHYHDSLSNCSLFFLFRLQFQMNSCLHKSLLLSRALCSPFGDSDWRNAPSTVAAPCPAPECPVPDVGVTRCGVAIKLGPKLHARLGCWGPAHTPQTHSLKI